MNASAFQVIIAVGILRLVKAGEMTGAYWMLGLMVAVAIVDLVLRELERDEARERAARAANAQYTRR